MWPDIHEAWTPFWLQAWFYALIIWGTLLVLIAIGAIRKNLKSAGSSRLEGPTAAQPATSVGRTQRSEISRPKAA